MSTSHSKVVVDHESDLSSSEEPILFLGFLFLETDLHLEVGILDDLVQSRSNLRVQHLRIFLKKIQKWIARTSILPKN